MNTQTHVLLAAVAVGGIATALNNRMVAQDPRPLLSDFTETLDDVSHRVGCVVARYQLVHYVRVCTTD